LKVRVIHDFRDKTAELQLRKKGETLDVDARRAEYLADLGLVEEIKENKAKKTTE